MAVVKGPFFPGWEFDTLFGFTRAEIAELVAAWPEVDFDDEEVRRAISVALVQLTGYPHGEEEAWHRFISVSPSAVEALLMKYSREYAG
ncbi:MAG: hypothetical protein SX243_25000 [Acidobacteriota bacterium]|nr:hypothetical protein [Acidobacteriota bacterium]